MNRKLIRSRGDLEVSQLAFEAAMRWAKPPKPEFGPNSRPVAAI